MSEVSRRRLLQLAAGLAATAACGDDPETQAATPTPRADAGAVPAPPPTTVPDGGPPPDTTVPAVDLSGTAVDAEAFPYGVMAGDATSSSVMLWTRALATTGTLHVQVEAEDGPAGRAVLSRAVTDAERGDGGFIHVDATALTPGARYRYAFFVNEGPAPTKRSAFGTVRAALAPGALEIVTFAGTSCTHQIQGGAYPVLAEAAKRKVDFFLHGGDHVYCDADADAVTLADYRAKYGQAWSKEGMRELHGSTGMILTWDDHEILNNWNPETLAATRVADARKAFFEHRAFRRDRAAPDRLWRSFAWGDTLEILVLDVRSERKPSTRAAANAQFITRAQMDWLKDRLAKSTAVFKLVVTSVPITNFPAAAAGEADKWEGYPAQREEILTFIETQQLKGVWWLSGDLHFGSLGGIGTAGARLAMKEVLMGPGGTTARTDIDLPAARFDTVVMEKNFTLFQADPVKRELSVEFVGAGGKSIFKRTYAA